MGIKAAIKNDLAKFVLRITSTPPVIPRRHAVLFAAPRRSSEQGSASLQKKMHKPCRSIIFNELQADGCAKN
jgi:hypothetical protein